MDNCIFCKIARKEIPAEIIRETEHFVSIVDIAPNNPGHSLLIPKKHYRTIYEIEGEASRMLGEEISSLAKAIKKAVDADGINIHMNNESAAGQVVSHQHTHIIPRFEGDGLHHWPQNKYNSGDEIQAVRKKIQSAIDSRES